MDVLRTRELAIISAPPSLKAVNDRFCNENENTIILKIYDILRKKTKLLVCYEYERSVTEAGTT